MLKLNAKQIEDAKLRVRRYSNITGLSDYEIIFKKKGSKRTHGLETLESIEETKKWIEIVNENLGKNIVAKNRLPENVLYRQALAYILFEKNLNKYGIAVGFNQNHTTLLHSLKVAKQYLEIKDPQFLPYYNDIKKIVNN
jgi:hypothetical protein